MYNLEMRSAGLWLRVSKEHVAFIVMGSSPGSLRFPRPDFVTIRRTITPSQWVGDRRSDLVPTQHTQNTHNRQTSMLRWDSNQRSQQASGRRPTP